MIANDNKSKLSLFSLFKKLVDQYNNTDQHSINKKPVDADCSASTEKIDTNPKAPKVKVKDRVRITKYNNIFCKRYTETWSREIFIIDSVLKTNPWAYKLKYLSKEKVTGSFSETCCK